MDKHREEFYPDGVTRPTDPFYITLCPNGHEIYSCIYRKKCFECGEKLISCLPANKVKKEKVS